MSYRIAFMTLGCKVNQYETEKLQKQCEAAGYIVVPFDGQADIYVVNTCTVTNIADRKSRKMLHRGGRLNKNAIVVAMGCFADAAGESLVDDTTIHVVIGNSRKNEAFDIIDRAAKEKFCNGHEPVFEIAESEHNVIEARTRAYIKVQDGCNQFCSYCKIPYVRGRLKSRDEEDVYGEIVELAKKGYKEIVLTGIHLSSYGVDKSEFNTFTRLEGAPLFNLIEKLASVDGIERIRLGSLEPRIVTEGFISRLAGIKKVCPHFHLSLQSGCDTTLARMNRKYNTKDYIDACDILRKYFDAPAITTDIIVGFPGETEEEFEQTLQYVKAVRFADVHVFKYSRRDGTRAAVMPDQVDEAIKGERSNRLIECTDSLTHDYITGMIGKKQLCLVEEKTEINGEMYWVGHNERYARLGLKADGTDNISNKVVEIIPCGILDNILI